MENKHFSSNIIICHRMDIVCFTRLTIIENGYSYRAQYIAVMFG